MPAKGLDDSYRINVRAHFVAAKAALPQMKRQGKGAIDEADSRRGFYGWIDGVYMKMLAWSMQHRFAVAGLDPGRPERVPGSRPGPLGRRIGGRP